MVDPASFAKTVPALRVSPSLASPSGTPASAGKTEAAGAGPTLPKLIELASELARQGPPVDYARIAQIRQAIASGRYELDPAATARAMLAFDRGVSGSG